MTTNSYTIDIYEFTKQLANKYTKEAEKQSGIKKSSLQSFARHNGVNSEKAGGKSQKLSQELEKSKAKKHKGRNI
jgi:hypothetical protein